MTLNPALSSYLDFMRFTAAFAVLLGHMDLDGLSMSWMPLAGYSHEAVIIFFVLSGFIIYYSTTSRASSWQQYAVARLSRIYSVAFPAVLVCVGLALWLASQPGFNPKLFSNYSEPTLWDVASSLLFINESWLHGKVVPMNHPYWTLCYEVWYYAIFGAFFFGRPRWRWWLVGLAAAVAGPAILLLFPVWVLGAWLAASGRYDASWPKGWAVFLFLGSLAVVVAINVAELDAMVQSFLYNHVPGFWRLDGSQRFVTDYVIGAALCLHIVAFSSLPASVHQFFERYQGLFASIAGFSFTLYLFHRPMTQLLGAAFPQPVGAVWQTALIACGILLACWTISWGTERQLPRWRRGFARLIQPRP